MSSRPQRGVCLAIAFRVIVGFICLCATITMANSAPVPNLDSQEALLPVPIGLVACSSDDSVAAVEKQLAPRLGAKFVGCFKSQETTKLRGRVAGHTVPMEYAIALQILGGPFSPASLDSLLSRVRDQWKNFKPLSKEHAEYVSRLNAMIQAVASKTDSTTIASIEPVLVSIDRLNPEAYVVLSVRQYVFTGESETITQIKANGTAMVLQGPRLMHLEIIRELRNPSDVDAVRQQILAWTDEIATHAGDKSRSQ